MWSWRPPGKRVLCRKRRELPESRTPAAQDQEVAGTVEAGMQKKSLGLMKSSITGQYNPRSPPSYM